MIIIIWLKCLLRQTQKAFHYVVIVMSIGFVSPTLEVWCGTMETVIIIMNVSWLVFMSTPENHELRMIRFIPFFPPFFSQSNKNTTKHRYTPSHAHMGTVQTHLSLGYTHARTQTPSFPPSSSVICFYSPPVTCQVQSVQDWQTWFWLVAECDI